MNNADYDEVRKTVVSSPDKIKGLEAKVEKLSNLLKEVMDDLLERAEVDSDGTRIVNVGRSVWIKLCDFEEAK